MSGRIAVGPALRRALLRTLLAVAVLLALVWAVAATGLGMGLVLPWALARAAPEGWTVRIASVDGAWGSRVHLKGLSMWGPETSVAAEEVLLEYRLLPLLERTIYVRRIHLVSTSVEGAVPDSSTQDVPAAESAGNEQSVLHRLLSGSPLGRWTLRLGELLEAGALRYSDLNARLEGCGTYILAARLKAADRVALRVLPDGASTMTASIVGLSFSTGPRQADYIPTGHRALGSDGWLTLDAALGALKRNDH